MWEEDIYIREHPGLEKLERQSSEGVTMWWRPSLGPSAKRRCLQYFSTHQWHSDYLLRDGQAEPIDQEEGKGNGS